VIDALKIIEPKITGLSFIGEDSLKSERYPIVKLEGSPNLYPLKAMGDGVNRILNFILALVNSDNGFLLIDEFENGLHYSVQEKLWEIIFEISNRLNVQVFATTHSNDTINSFARVLGKSKGFEGSLYRLDRKGDEVRTYMFPEEEIKEAAIQHINMR
ncbi:MAG: ATP-binding protein, partial [Bacteroidetes bacterium]